MSFGIRKSTIWKDWNWKFDEFHGLIERCLTFFYCISSSQTRPFVHSYFLIPNTCLCIWPNISPQQLFITYYYLFLYALIPTYILYIKIYSIKDIPFYILYCYYFVICLELISSVTNNTWVRIFLPGITLSGSIVSPF